jgi:hypothetical protein
MQYINKSVFIEALQFNGRNLPEIEEFTEYSNVISATILNNVLYLIIKTPNKADVERIHVLPNEYLVKDASGWITKYEEEQIKSYWIPFNVQK